MNQSTCITSDYDGSILVNQATPLAEDLLKTQKLVIKEEQQLNGSLKDLVKIRRHFINLLILVYIWIASSFNMYLLTYNLKYIQGDFFRNNIVSASTDIPVCILGGVLYHKLGIKLTLFIAFCI
jgi:hypothetical protein